MNPWKRVEHIGNATLYLGDARKILPRLTADVIIIDPVWPNCPEDLLPGSENPWRLFRQAWRKMPRVKRAVVVMRHDSDPRFLMQVRLPYARTVYLPYVIPGYIGRYLGGDEIAYCFGEPIPSRPGQRVIPGRANPVQPMGQKANGHPCSRALKHFEFLVRWWSEPEEIVGDPFMGSGTTLCACIILGRKCWGIEIDETYFNIACKRIKREWENRPRLFEKVEPVQGILL